MNAPDSVADPLAALPVLAEAGVSVHWVALDGRTAWIADPATREVWLSRAIPPSSLLRYFVEALQALDDSDSGSDTADADPRTGPGITLVHSSPQAAEPSTGARPALRSVRRTPRRGCGDAGSGGRSRR